MKDVNTVEEHRKYWNEERNTRYYEKNNFSIFDDPKARLFILGRLDGILTSPDFIVADLGCGPGHILAYLSGKCRGVVKIDYAENMLAEARRRNPDLKNITYVWGDMRDLRSWAGRFNVVIATNSILAGSITKSEMMTREIYSCLVAGGLLVAVMPSAETLNYLARLKYARLTAQGVTEAEAVAKVREEFGRHEFDGLFGFYRDDDGTLRQKYFYRDEIKLVFKKSGFRIRTISKLRYGWKHCRKYNYDYFPGEDGIYDWFAIAEKPA